MLLRTDGLVFLILLFTVLDRSDDTTASARHKRYIAFRKGSSFFYRLNYKVSTLSHTKIFAQASGFKISWELPSGQHIGKSRKISFDDLQEGASLLYSSHGFDGKICLLKSLCQAMEYVKQRNGIFMKILNLLFGSYRGNGTSVLDPIVCRNYANHCPLHLIRFNAFTEY